MCSICRSAGSLSASRIFKHTINANWLYSQALGEVKLAVPEGQAEDARKLLAADFSEAIEAEFGKDDYLCPSCGSSNNQNFTRGKLPAYVVFILIGMPLFFYKHGGKCNDCGQFWET